MGGAIMSENLGNQKTGLAQDLDNSREDVLKQLRRDKRGLAQLDRLRQLQIMNTITISTLERAKAKLVRHARIHSLVRTGDQALIKEKIEDLNASLKKLKSTIKEIESSLDAHAEEGLNLVSDLRTLHRTFTADTGRKRELLFTNIHQEEQMKARLGVLRGDKIQKLRLLSLLQEALAE